MPSTLRQYRQEMLLRYPELGRVETAITSLTATTVVVNALRGRFRDDYFIDRYILRPNAADSADRIRRVSDWAESTGTFTQPGPNYADTTATGEALEVHEYDPDLLDAAIERVLHMRWRVGETVFPTSPSRRLYLGISEWIRGAGHIVAAYRRNSPVLNRNRYFSDWNDIDSTGALTPDYWTLSGSGATMAREATIVEHQGRYSVKLTRAGTDCAISQNVWQWPGLADDSLRGETVIAGARVYATVANRARIRIFDGVDTTNSSYHSGGSTFETLTTPAHPVNTSATELTVSLRVETGDTSAYAADLWIAHASSVDNAIWQDNYQKYLLYQADNLFEGGPNQPELWLPQAYGWGSQIIVKSWRPWLPEDTRFNGDGYNCDAPLGLVADGARKVLERTLRNQSRDAEERRWHAGLELELRRGWAAQVGNLLGDEGAQSDYRARHFAPHLGRR